MVSQEKSHHLALLSFVRVASREGPQIFGNLCPEIDTLGADVSSEDSAVGLVHAVLLLHVVLFFKQTLVSEIVDDGICDGSIVDLLPLLFELDHHLLFHGPKEVSDRSLVIEGSLQHQSLADL